MKKIVQVFVILFFANSCQSANILAIFPHLGKSHFFMFEPFVIKLNSLGHDITVVSHFPPSGSDHSINHINLQSNADKVFFNNFDLSLVPEYFPGPLKVVASLIALNQIGLDVCRQGLANPNFLNYLKSKPKVDLVIVEFFNTDCFAGAAHYFNAPLIGMFSSVMMPWHNDRFGNPDNPAYIPNHFVALPQRMTFLQRLANTAALLLTKSVYRVFNEPASYQLAKQTFGEDLPPLNQIVSNSSLFMINSHFSLFQPRPLVPGIIELGGFHVKPAKKLPDDLEKYLNNSPHGVVYFSFGSTAKSSTMPSKKRKSLLNAFSKIKQNVLMKWEEDVLEGKPDNVYISKWLPQNDLLGHPKVKVFVTHAGLMGTAEAVYHGIPMVLVPILGDQPVNAASCAEKGIGILIDYNALNEQNMYEALSEVINNKTYADNAKRLAKIFLDRPLSIMDTALYWTEYVIRHNGAYHLRSAVIDLPWYQEYLLDVGLVLLLITASFLFLIFKMFKSFFKLICCRSKKQKKVSKTKKTQ